MPEWCASPLEGRLCSLESCVKPVFVALYDWSRLRNTRRLLPQGENGAMPSKGDLPGLTWHPNSFLLKLAK